MRKQAQPTPAVFAPLGALASTATGSAPPGLAVRPGNFKFRRRLGVKLLFPSQRTAHGFNLKFKLGSAWALRGSMATGTGNCTASLCHWQCQTQVASASALPACHWHWHWQ